ncbi:hypothetical protein BDZ94DRAFT_1240880 [Collybia nuda]|uniref:Uncharacterized protein n=1 Tax=Collybia nuda TaxID=64659 RepID=A0A9P6CDS4_9AGAR|nr:hypothetical protein BDZ94DRAFT_1240880 [Collybia nuda]
MKKTELPLLRLRNTRAEEGKRWGATIINNFFFSVDTMHLVHTSFDPSTAEILTKKKRQRRGALAPLPHMSRGPPNPLPNPRGVRRSPTTPKTVHVPIWLAPPVNLIGASHEWTLLTSTSTKVSASLWIVQGRISFASEDLRASWLGGGEPCTRKTLFFPEWLRAENSGSGLPYPYWSLGSVLWIVEGVGSITTLDHCWGYSHIEAINEKRIAQKYGQFPVLEKSSSERPLAVVGWVNWVVFLRSACGSATLTPEERKRISEHGPKNRIYDGNVQVSSDDCNSFDDGRFLQWSLVRLITCARIILWNDDTTPPLSIVNHTLKMGPSEIIRAWLFFEGLLATEWVDDHRRRLGT